MAEFLQQYEDNGRLINKFRDENGNEFFEDAGPVQAAPEAVYNSGNAAWDEWARNGFTGHTAEQLSGSPMYGFSPETGHNQIVDYVNSNNAGAQAVAANGAVNVPTATTPGQNTPTNVPPANTPPGQTQPAPTGPSAMERMLADNAARNAANDAAKLAYDNAMLRFRNDELAETLAQNAWKRTFEESSRAWNQGWQEKEAARQQEQWSKQFGLSESAVTGTYNGAPTEQRIGRENNTAMGLLNLGASLKGPSNYLTYLRTLSNTPAGLSSLLNGLKGSSAFSSMQANNPNALYERQSVGTLMRDFQQGAGQTGTDASGVDLPGGAQWNARNFGILRKDPTQLGLLQNLYEEGGRDFGTEYAGFLSSLPRFGGAQSARVRV